MSPLNQTEILQRWLALLGTSSTRVTQLLSEGELQALTKGLLADLLTALERSPGADIQAAGYGPLRARLEEVSADFAERGLTPSETATFIFSLKQVLFEAYQRDMSGQPLVDAIRSTGDALDQLGLFTFETFSNARERIVRSQAQALTELSTPVIQVWEGIIALPLVGAIDSVRAKEIMEKLLDSVVQYSADIVILDITGVAVVDTQVANRLMRSVEAVRLLGTRSIITGINPVIAQTLVQLGVDLSQLNTKASLRAGLQQAFRDLRLKVVSAAEVQR